jgi:hypothetical protein
MPQQLIADRPFAAFPQSFNVGAGPEAWRYCHFAVAVFLAASLSN